MAPADQRLRQVLAAALLACYGILALAAMGPHAHDLGAGIASSKRSPAVAPGGMEPRGESGLLRSDCPLCSWSRGVSRPEPAAASGAPPPAAEHHGTDPTVEGWHPPVRWVLLRAPPAA